jgi:hypothetical protein
MNAAKSVEIGIDFFHQQDISRSGFVTSTHHQSPTSFSWTSSLLTKDPHFHCTPPSIVERNSLLLDTPIGRAMHSKAVTVAVGDSAKNYAKQYSGSTSKAIPKAIDTSKHQPRGTSSARYDIPCLFPMDGYILPQYRNSKFRCPVTFDF